MSLEISKTSAISASNHRKLAEFDKRIAQNKSIRTSERDKVSFSSNKAEKVSFLEGTKLVASGFWNKTKELVKTIVKHPLQVIGAIALTTAALTALPLIGIASTTGMAGLALVFAGIAIGKSIYHISNAVKHNKDGKYNEVRKDLRKIGGDGLDLALSMPFVPKAINAVKRQAKFTTNGLKPVFNKKLWNSVKETKGLWNKVKEVFKGDLRIAYGQHVKEQGLKLAPELKLAEIKAGIAAYKPLEGTITLNTKAKKFNPFFRNYWDGALKHELKHFEQYKQIARTENIGIQGIKQAAANRLNPNKTQVQIERVKTAIEKYHNPSPPKNFIQKMLRPIARRLFGKKYLKKLQKEVDYLEGLKEGKGRINFNEVMKKKGVREKVIKAYNLNSQTKLDELLKTSQFRKNLIDAILKKDDAKINAKFYQKIIDTEGKIAAGTPEATQAAKYFDASSNYTGLNKYSFINNKAYKQNLLEQEAYAVQKQFNKGRPSIKTNIIQELTNIADK